MIHPELGSHLNLAEGLSRRRTPFLKPFVTISVPAERAALRGPLPGRGQEGQDIRDHQERRRRRGRPRRGQCGN